MWSKPQKAPVQQNHLSAAFGGTSPQGEAVGRLPVRGKPAKRRQRVEVSIVAYDKAKHLLRYDLPLHRLPLMGRLR